MWMTMNALVVLFGFASLGIGLSLMNTIARHDGRGDVAAQRSAFSNALAIGVGLALVLSLLAVIIGPLIPWWRVFNVSSPLAISEAAPSMAVLAASFVIGIPLGLGGSVWAGLQRTYVAALFVALGSILGILGISACVATGQGMPLLVAAATGGPLLALAIGTGVLVVRRPDLRPFAGLVTRSGMRQLLALGLGFFLLQVAISVATSSDSLVLAQVIGPSSVTDYSVVWRLFNVPLVLAISVVYVLWPGLSEARSRGDHEWVTATHRKVLLAVVGIALPLVVILMIAGPAIASAVSHGSVEPGSGLFVAFAVATIAVALTNTESVFLNSAGVVWPLVVCWGTMAVCNIVLGIFLSARVGTSGVVWSTAVTEGLMLIPLAVIGHRVERPAHHSQ